MTLIERTARAAWVKVQEQVPESVRLTDWDRVPEDAKNNFRSFVRAVLTEAREPTEAMLDAANDRSVQGSRSMAELAWKEMIDAALEEK